MFNGNLTLKGIARKLEQEYDIGNDIKKARPMITLCFDDGYRSDYDIAFPILQQHGLRASFYIINWNSRPEKWIQESEIKELSDCGHEIGCHTQTHSGLTTLTDEEIIEELTNTKKYLENITGKPVLTHAYPAGRTNEHVDNIVGGIYESSRGTLHNSKETALDGQFTHGRYRFNLYGRSPLYNLAATSVDARTGQQTIQLIDTFLNLPEPAYFVFYMHRIYEDNDTERPENRMKRSDFEEWIAYLSNLKEQGLVDVVPYIEGVRRLNGARSTYL